MRALRPTAAAAVALAFLGAPAPLGAAEPAPGPGFSRATLATGGTAGEARLRTGPRSGRVVVRAAASRTVGVTMGDFFYDPETVTVSAGDTVTWTNVGEVPEGHTITGDGFDSGVVEEGERFSHRFDAAGAYPYICSLHDNMSGTVVVRAASGGSGGQGAGAGGGGTGAGEDTAAEEAAEDDGSAPRDDDGSGAASGAGGSGGGGSFSSGASSADASSDADGSRPGDGFDGPLAYTGLNLILLFEVGVGLLAGGCLIRRLLSDPGPARAGR